MLCISITCFATELKDPTRPPDSILLTAEKSPIQNIKLSGIFTASPGSHTQNSAIINGQILTEGDVIETPGKENEGSVTYQVSNIQPSFVSLKNSQGIFMIP